MRRLRACFVLAVAVVLVGLWLSPADAGTQTTANVVARDPHGKVLPDDPLLLVGEHIQLTITGFGPRTRVVVRLGPRQIGSYITDARGRVVFTFVVPLNLTKGTYVVAAIGLPPLSKVTPSRSSGDASVDPQLIEGLVPNLGIFLFHVDPGGGSTSPTRPTSPTHPSSPNTSGLGASSGSSGNQGHLGSTGVDVSLLLLVGAAGLILGWLFLLPGRKRKHA